jgi:hypothetical protein
MKIRTLFMSKKNPECPLYNPLNCKEYYNPKLCAFVRKDRLCLKKKNPEPQTPLMTIKTKNPPPMKRDAQSLRPFAKPARIHHMRRHAAAIFQSALKAVQADAAVLRACRLKRHSFHRPFVR